MARKVSLESNSIAFVDDDRVDEPGFYVMEGDTTESDVDVQDHGKFTGVGTDDDGNTILETDARGRPVFATLPSVVETISVKHETEMTPGRRVWPSPDGDGFVFNEPKDGQEEGDE